MSQAGSEDFTAPLSPSLVSESGSVQSLRGWTIPKLTAELRRRGVPFPATVRKGELFKLLFPPPAAGPSTQQASLQSISSAISQLHTMVSSLSTSVTDVQTRVALLEARPATAVPDPTATQTLTPLPAGTSGWSPIVYPSHLVPTSTRKDILDGRDINLASLLISVHDLAENKAFSWGDISVVLKAKDPRLNRKLSVPEFTLAFGMLRDVLCSATPSRREELDLYLHTVVDLGYKYGGFAFYDYHGSFSAKAAARLTQFQTTTNWSLMDTKLFCRHFAGLRSPLCAICQSSTHTATWCANAATRQPFEFPSTSGTIQGQSPPEPTPQVDKFGRPVRTVGGAAICNNYNYGSCNFSQCRLLHICTLCQRAHPRNLCEVKQHKRA